MSEPHPPSLYSANLTNSQVIVRGSHFEKTLQYAWTFLTTADRNDLTRKSLTRIWHWNSMLLLLLSHFSLSDSVWPHRRQPTRLPRPWDSPGKNTGVGCHFLLQCVKVKSETEVAQSCPTLRDPMDCSPPGSSVHGIFQARALEWVAIAFSWNSISYINNRGRIKNLHLTSRYRGRGEVWQDSFVPNMFPVPESSPSMRLSSTCHPPVLQGFLIAYWKPGLLRWLSGKQSPCQCRKCMFDPWGGKIPWRRKLQPTPVILPGKSHGEVPGGLQFMGYQRVRRFTATTTDKLLFLLLWLLWVSHVI